MKRFKLVVCEVVLYIFFILNMFFVLYIKQTDAALK